MLLFPIYCRSQGTSIDTLAQFDTYPTQTQSELNSGAYLMLANSGVLRTDDAFETIQAVMPNTYAFLLSSNPYFHQDDATTVYALGLKEMTPKEWQAFRSTDDGVTWSIFAYSDSLGARGLPPRQMDYHYKFSVSRDNWVRFYGAYYDPNSLSWYIEPDTTCLPTYTRPETEQDRVVHVGNGVYQAWDSDQGKWYQVNIVSGECTESPVPDSGFYLIVPRGTTDYALGIHSLPTTPIWRRTTPSDSFALVDPIETDRDTLASFSISSPPLNVGGYTLLICKAKDRVVYIDRDRIRELNLASWRKCIETEPDGVYLSGISSGDSTALLFLYSQTCGNNLALFSLVTGEMIEDFAYAPEYAMDYRYLHLTPKGVVQAKADGAFVRTDLHTGVRKRVGRYVGTDSSIRRPIAFCDNAYLGDTLCSVDQYGFINQIQSSDSCVLPYFLYDNKVDFSLRNGHFTPFSIGLPRLVPLKGALASLGPSFKVLYNRTTFTEKRKDTVSSALQRSDGSWLLGYRSLFATSDSGATRTLVSSPADSVSAISGIVETGNGGLLVSRRGYNLRGRGPEPVDVVGGLWLQPKPEAPWQQVGTELVETEDIGPMVLSITHNSLDSSIWVSSCWVNVVAQFAQINNGDSSFYYSGSVYDYRLHRSSDDGMSWQLMARVDDNWNYAPTTGSVSFSSTGKIAWTLHDRIMISSDGGMQWQSTQDQGTLGIPICSAMFDRQDNLVIASRNGLFSIPANTVSVHEETAASEQSRIRVTTQPNPTNGSFTVSLYNLDHLSGAMQRLHIVDVAGRVIADITSLVAGNYSSGRVDVPVVLGRIPSGVYMFIGTDGHRTFTHPFVVVME